MENAYTSAAPFALSKFQQIQFSKTFKTFSCLERTGGLLALLFVIICQNVSTPHTIQQLAEKPRQPQLSLAHKTGKKSRQREAFDKYFTFFHFIEFSHQLFRESRARLSGHGGPGNYWIFDMRSPLKLLFEAAVCLLYAGAFMCVKFIWSSEHLEQAENSKMNQRLSEHLRTKSLLGRTLSVHANISQRLVASSTPSSCAAFCSSRYANMAYCIMHVYMSTMPFPIMIKKPAAVSNWRGKTKMQKNKTRQNFMNCSSSALKAFFSLHRRI